MGADRVRRDLKRYAAKAVEMGATRACIVRARDIPVDERVTLKCQVPRCFGYGTGANCPPNTLKPAELRAILARCGWAVFFTLDVPPAVIVKDKSTIVERVAAYQLVSRIVSGIESAAFYDGHYLAFGFSAGSCRHTFCGREEDCEAMKGHRCRFALKARPSMEAVGIDIFRLCASQGWEIYPIGSSVTSAEVPKGTLAGIVVVR